jgi:hypothetical protein
LGGGLDQLTGGQGPGHPALQRLIAILASEPNLDPSFSQGLLAQAMGNITAQQDQRQQAGAQAFDTASQGLMGLATSGYGTPQGLDALTGAYQQMSPQLNRPALAGRLDALTGSLGDVAATVPNTTSTTGPEPLGGDSFAAIDADLESWASGATPKPDGEPYALHDAIMAVTQPLRAQGYSEEDLQRVIAYITQKWEFLKSAG